jgi:hypothetical protein
MIKIKQQFSLSASMGERVGVRWLMFRRSAFSNQPLAFSMLTSDFWLPASVLIPAWTGWSGEEANF